MDRATNTKTMNRFELTKRLVSRLKNDEAVVAGIGNTNFDLWASGRRPQNFYMLGSMGLAFPIALGVALAQPKRRVIALEGDGSLLMQLGCLTTIAMLSPANLTLVTFDNGIYQITGGQPTPAAGATKTISTGCSMQRWRPASRTSSPHTSTRSRPKRPHIAIPCRSGNAS
jgi:thiamine pyrophosphate-dependent acetolactate synthase large subunit-like protein